jgi:Family of unknown function (DUF5670)
MLTALIVLIVFTIMFVVLIWWNRRWSYKMGGSISWLALGVLLFLAWGLTYFVFHVTGVLIHLLLVCALMSFMFSAFIGKRGVE